MRKISRFTLVIMFMLVALLGNPLWYSGVLAKAGETGYISVSSLQSTLAVKADGSLWMSNAVSGMTKMAEGTVLPAGLKAQSVSVSNWHSAVLSDQGEVWTWGANNVGQLGNGSTIDSYSKAVKVAGLENVTSITGGTMHSVALKDDGTVWAWGGNDFGQLGNETNSQSNIPVQVAGLTNVIALATGPYHSLAVQAGGKVWAWGNNGQGGLGNGTYTHSNKPTEVQGLPAGENIIAVAASQVHSMAVTESGEVWAWGGNGDGQLGDGTRIYRNKAVKVIGLPDPATDKVTSIAVGESYSFAVTESGRVWAWGNNADGQLGLGVSIASTTTPMQITGLAGINIKSVVAGGYCNFAISETGEVWGWGSNYSGQQGDGSKDTHYEPVLMRGTTDSAKSEVHLSSANSVPANGNAGPTITIALADSQGRAVVGHMVSMSQGNASSTITPLGSSITDANGSVSFRITNTTAETVTYRVRDNTDNLELDKTAQVTFVPGPTDAGKSIVTAVSNGSDRATITVALKDAKDRAVEGHTVSLSALGGVNTTIVPVNGSGVSAADGTVSFSVKSAIAQTVFFTAKDVTDNVNLIQPSLITFLSGPTDASKSRVEAAPTKVLANGSSPSTVTVTLLDANQQPVQGHSVSLTATGGSSQISAPSGVSAADGTVTFTVTNRTVENVVYTATDMTDHANPIAIGQTVQVAFTRPYVPPVYYPVEGVSLDKTALSMQEGGSSATLYAAITPSYATNQQVTWSSSNPLVATVSQDGKVTPVGAGEAIITVTTIDRNKTAACSVRVSAKEEPKLLGLEATAYDLLLKPNETAKFTVFANYSDGRKEDITDERKVTYTSNSTKIASVKPGVIKARTKEGEAVVIISFGGQTIEINVTVSKAKLTELRFSPEQVSLEIGENKQLQLIAVLSDERTKEVTESAIWSSADPEIVSVKNGKLTAGEKGTTTITATYGGKTAELEVTVVKEKRAKKLTASKRKIMLEQDERALLNVMAEYQDGTKADVTERSKWAVRDKAIATAEDGVITGIAPGKTTVTATYGGKRVSITVEVKEAKELKRISASKQTVNLKAGKTQQVKLTAYYKDGSKVDVSEKAEWTTSDKRVASVKDGVITAIAPGSATIKVEYRGKTATVKVIVK